MGVQGEKPEGQPLFLVRVLLALRDLESPSAARNLSWFEGAQVTRRDHQSNRQPLIVHLPGKLQSQPSGYSYA
jgi:hypothetical protein